MPPENDNIGGQPNTDPAGENWQGQQSTDGQQQQGAGEGDGGNADPANQGAQGDGGQGDGAGDAGKQAGEGDGDGKDDGEGDKQPVNYDLKLPDGFTFDEEIQKGLVEFANEKNLTQDEAQKLVDLGVKMRQREAAVFQETQKQWIEQIKADPVLGGAQLNENIAVAKKAIDTFGTPELKGLLDSTGFGNHPEVVSAFFKIGKAISEDKLVIGQGKPRGAADPAKRLFPNQN